jgi:hypothetical protein
MENRSIDYTHNYYLITKIDLDVGTVGFWLDHDNSFTEKTNE